MLKPSVSELFRTSTRSILKNKGRTILTSLGIIIGVTSVILLTAIGNGLQKYIANQFEALGSNLVFVLPGKVFNDRGGFNGGGGSFSPTKFDMKDVLDLKRNLKDASAVLPAIQAMQTIKYRTIQKDTMMGGATYDYGKIRNTEPSSGHGTWFSKEEEEKKNKVVILGFQTAKDLFGNQNPLGKTVVIGGKNLKVIGVVDKKGGGGFGGEDQDAVAYVPLEVGFDIIGKTDIQTILIKAVNKDQIDTVKKETEKILLKMFDKDAFSVVDQSQILSSINSIIGTLTIALTGIAAISLIVGGIGIMNIMLVTVSERTREIGLRKAVGATPRAILLQFLFEAVILSCIEGVVGIILGSLAAKALNSAFPAVVTLNSILLAFGVSSAVGIIFGVTPARRASLLSPIEALRYE